MKLLPVLLLFAFFTNCSDDDCSDGDMAIVFDIQIQLISETTGENVLDDPDFEVNALKFVDTETLISSPIERIITTNNGQKAIVYAPINQRNLRVEYNAVALTSFKITNVAQSVEDCVVQVQSYTVSSENVLICNCTVEDTFILEIPF